MLTELSVQHFLDALASGDPAPGGGSAAALAGAQGAALISMVCNLTVGRKKYASVEAELLECRARADALRAQLAGLIDRDTAAYEVVMSAYKLTKETPDQVAARTAAIQSALRQATSTPLETLAACVEVLELCPVVLAKGNPNAVSDGAAGMLAAHAGMHAAALNVRINLNAIDDNGFVSETTAKMSSLLERGETARIATWQLAEQAVGGR